MRPDPWTRLARRVRRCRAADAGPLAAAGRTLARRHDGKAQCGASASPPAGAERSLGPRGSLPVSLGHRGALATKLGGPCGPILVLMGFLLPGAGSLAEEPNNFDGELPVSGYHYMGELVRALQDDEFLNPGLFAVEHGAELWSAVEGTQGASCATCHGDATRSMRGVAARYPAYDPKQGRLVNLELRINEERTKRMGAPALPMESEELLALAAFVTRQSRGMPMEVDISGEARRYWEDGKAFYERRRGQLDLACDQCHGRLAGRRLRGDRISQGHVNGFPFYRLMWRSMGSRHRMFRWCNWAVRAETHELGSPEYLSLELYVAWRGRGLPIEAPAVRP